MVYKKVEIIGAYVIPGRGQILLTLDQTVQQGQIIEVSNKVWRVLGVERSASVPHITLLVTSYSESAEKQAVANDARAILENIFRQSESAIIAANATDDEPSAGFGYAGIDPNTPKPVAPQEPTATKHPSSNEEQKLKLTTALSELSRHMAIMRDWTLQKLSEFNLDKDPPSVLVMVISMPRGGMKEYAKQLENFLVASINTLEKDGKLPWANVKAVAGSLQ